MSNKHMPDDYYKTLPTKRMGTGVLFFNSEDKLLIVKPSYKNYWSIPGGVVDDKESPRQAGIREAKEEVNIDAGGLRFVCLDYISGEDGKGENLQFIFYGGVLSQTQIEDIKIDGKEIVEYKFAEPKEALALFGEGRKLSLRFPKCFDAIKTNTAIYLENGNII